MIDHHIQKKVINSLVETESARYSELKPDNVEGNVFAYHLQNLVKQDLILKNSDGSYSLTSTGKLFGINGSLKNKDLLKQAHSIILLCIREGDSWLLRKRLVQPMYGKLGFMHGESLAGESINESAKRILDYRCGLNGEFSIKGSGFICIKEKGQLVAYSNFTLIEVDNISGKLIKEDSHGQNIWYENPEFESEEMIPSMFDIVNELKKPGMFFLDKSYNLE